MKQNAHYWIERLKLEKHPEGGYYKRTYASPNREFYESHNSERPSCTAIYYLLEATDFSAFHILKSDEIWHYYYGTCNLELHIIDTDQSLLTVELGTIGNSEPQVIIPKEKYFGARVVNKKPDDFVLVGCTVSPGFSFDDFALANKDELLKIYPQHEKIIHEFTR